MGRFNWLLDPGHGGIVNGEYVTAPKKMYKFEDGFIIYEGVFNRMVVNRLAEKLKKNGYSFDLIVDSETDVTLAERVRRADRINTTKPNSIYVSIHGNAGGGKGYEIYTSPGQTRSDRVAEFFFDGFEKVLIDSVQRKDTSDGDRDKEANFYVLRKTDCPAILTESGFMDNRKEAEFMTSEEGIEQIAEAHFLGIENTEKYF